MTPLKIRSNATAWEIAAAAALGVSFAVCLPLLGIVAFLLRGTFVAILAVAAAVVGSVWMWRVVLPSLGPRWRPALRDYVVPAAVGIAAIACMPLLAVAVIVLRGALLGVLAVVVGILLLTAIWRLGVPAHVRHAARLRGRPHLK